MRKDIFGPIFQKKTGKDGGRVCNICVHIYQITGNDKSTETLSTYFKIQLRSITKPFSALKSNKFTTQIINAVGSPHNAAVRCFVFYVPCQCGHDSLLEDQYKILYEIANIQNMHNIHHMHNV